MNVYWEFVQNFAKILLAIIAFLICCIDWDVPVSASSDRTVSVVAWKESWSPAVIEPSGSLGQWDSDFFFAALRQVKEAAADWRVAIFSRTCTGVWDRQINNPKLSACMWAVSTALRDKSDRFDEIGWSVRWNLRVWQIFAVGPMLCKPTCVDIFYSIQ